MKIFIEQTCAFSMQYLTLGLITPDMFQRVKQATKTVFSMVVDSIPSSMMDVLLRYDAFVQIDDMQRELSVVGEDKVKISLAFESNDVDPQRPCEAITGFWEELIDVYHQKQMHTIKEFFYTGGAYRLANDMLEGDPEWQQLNAEQAALRKQIERIDNEMAKRRKQIICDYIDSDQTHLHPYLGDIIEQWRVTSEGISG